jgi:hypothetical protein
MVTLADMLFAVVILYFFKVVTRGIRVNDSVTLGNVGENNQSRERCWKRKAGFWFVLSANVEGQAPTDVQTTKCP